MGTVHKNIKLPFGLKHSQLLRAMSCVGDKIQSMESLAEPRPLYQLIGKKSLSGSISHMMEVYLAQESKTLVKNTMDTGFPDLLPAGKYKNDGVKIGKGLEVKTTGLNSLSVSGHNAEDTWVIVFHYNVNPFSWRAVYIAKLVKSDWTMRERNGNNRITPTATINKSGRSKLRKGLVYST